MVEVEVGAYTGARGKLFLVGTLGVEEQERFFFRLFDVDHQLIKSRLEAEYFGLIVIQYLTNNWTAIQDTILHKGIADHLIGVLIVEPNAILCRCGNAAGIVKGISQI